jgi:hypothetical protein
MRILKNSAANRIRFAVKKCGTAHTNMRASQDGLDMGLPATADQRHHTGHLAALDMAAHDAGQAAKPHLG